MGILTLQTCWLILATLAILGLPGLALVRSLLPTMPLDQQIGLAPTGSVACWALLWLFGTLVGVPLGTLTISLVLLAALAALVVQVARACPRLSLRWETEGQALGWLLGVTLLCAAMRLFFWRDAVTALGSDGYHHSLISQLLIDHQALPNNYEPYAPIDSFSYHFAFHTLVASLHMITGRDAVTLTRFMGQIITVAGLLPLYALARSLGGTTRAGIAAVLCAGVLSAFPAFFINWSRLTQATALVVLPGALLVTVDLFERPRLDWRVLTLAMLLVASLFTAHYLILVFYLYALGWLLLTGIWRRVRIREKSVRWAMRAVPLGIGSLLLVSPWIYRLLRRSFGQVALGNVEGAADVGYFNLDQLGISWNSYRYLLLAAVLVGLALLVMHKRWAAWLLFWPAFSVAYSHPYWIPVALPGMALLDLVTAITSCYIPAAVLLGLGWSLLWPHVRALGSVVTGGVAVAAVALLAWGTVLQAGLYVPSERYVQPADLQAAHWLASSTPPNTMIMSNCYAWDWSPDYVISADAGGWMPLLARRSAIIPPIIRNLELMPDTGLSHRVTQLCKGLRDNPASNDVYDLLRHDHVSLIYLGERAGFIDPHKLAALPNRYRLLYREQDVEIFQVVYK